VYDRRYQRLGLGDAEPVGGGGVGGFPGVGEVGGEDV
jgi:hypothetical protein